MEQLRAYVISAVAAGILVGILTELTDGKSTAGVLLRLMGGLFLVFTVLRPVVQLELRDIQSYFAAFSAEGDAATAEGQAVAEDAYRSYIKAETEAYILDKAESYGASLSVEVTLDDGQTAVPVGAQLRGSISPYGKTCMKQMMEEELGIMEEDQIWIG